MKTDEPAGFSATPGWGRGVPGSSLPLIRWSCLVVLLLLEIIGLTLRFDSETLTGKRGGIGLDLIRHSHWVPKIGLTMALATMAIGSSRLADELGSSLAQLPRPHRWWFPLVGHLFSFGMLIWLTGQVMDEGLRFSADPEFWARAWIVAASCTIGFWGAAFIPPLLWIEWSRFARTWILLTIGAVVGLVSWAAGLWTAELWQPLGRSTLQCVHFLLSLIFSVTLLDTERSRVGTTSFWVEVAPECSGYEGVGLVLVSTIAYLWYFRHELRFPHSLLLLPLGTVLILLANVLRITILIAIGSWGWPRIAAGGFHSQAGWLAFNIVALSSIGLSQSFRFFWRDRVRFGDDRRTSNPSGPYLAPIIAILATTLITRAVADQFDWLYPLRPLVVLTMLWIYRNDYRAMRRDFSRQAVSIGILAFLIWMIFQPERTDADDQNTVATSEALAGLPIGLSAAWLSFRVIGSILTVPIAEELAFRGYLPRRLIAINFQDVPLGRFSCTSFFISSTLFGALHGLWIPGTLVGMLYAAAIARRGSLMDAIVAHATTNALLTGYVLFTGDWAMWS
ncbi:exosortase E/protease, VPEID-CTERM system [Tundrisphaera lichenicola]|uniref:exosortase E/protease, VPEID-CTERM system n=1 Tax=Tundrisphaera lichenicola TaxID=2029860 RepID=UPI003EBB4483